MAQRTVQLIIGQILTDEEFRSDFLEGPVDTLRALGENLLAHLEYEELNIQATVLRIREWVRTA